MCDAVASCQRIKNKVIKTDATATQDIYFPFPTELFSIEIILCKHRFLLLQKNCKKKNAYAFVETNFLSKLYYFSISHNKYWGFCVSLLVQKTLCGKQKIKSKENKRDFFELLSWFYLCIRCWTDWLKWPLPHWLLEFEWLSGWCGSIFSVVWLVASLQKISWDTQMFSSIVFPVTRPLCKAVAMPLIMNCAFISWMVLSS